MRLSYAIDTSFSIGIHPPQSLTCLAAANSFLSPIVLTAGSDKSIHAIDLGAPGGASIVLTLNEAHERPVHLLRLSEGSAYSEAPQAAHDLILSASEDGHVKLWDLRSASCVRKFSAHTNRLHLSARRSRRACATSSLVQRTARILTMPSRGAQSESQPPTMDAEDAAFSPMHPQLALGGLDGACGSTVMAGIEIESCPDGATQVYRISRDMHFIIQSPFAALLPQILPPRRDCGGSLGSRYAAPSS